MIDFVGTFPSLESVMGCHGDHALSHSHNQYYGEFFSHSGGPREQFGTKFKIALGVH